MNDESITPSGLRFLPGGLSRAVGKIKSILRREPSGDTPDPESGEVGVEKPADPPQPLLDEARHRIDHYASANADLLERASRFQKRYERLAEEGTPSESVGNRAVRARQEFSEGLHSLRTRFVREYGEEGGRAFDLQSRDLPDT